MKKENKLNKLIGRLFSDGIDADVGTNEINLYIYNTKLVRVVDGDTIVLDLDLGFDITRRVTIRLANVNTDEVYGVKKSSEEYARGKEQSEFVTQLLTENADNLIFHSLDYSGKYGRTIGDIEILNKGLLSEAIKEQFPHLAEGNE